MLCTAQVHCVQVKRWRGSANHVLWCGVCFCPEKEALFSNEHLRCRMDQERPRPHTHRSVHLCVSSFSTRSSAVRISHLRSCGFANTGSSPRPSWALPGLEATLPLCLNGLWATTELCLSGISTVLPASEL